MSMMREKMVDRFYKMCPDIKLQWIWICIFISMSPTPTPQQLHAIIAASVSIKSSQKLKKILEVGYTLYTELHSEFRRERIPCLTPCNIFISHLSDNSGSGELHEQQ